MPAQETVFDIIFGRQDWGDRPAILGDRACTYGELLARAEGLAGAISKCGVQGATVGVAIQPSLDYVTALLAVYLAGGVLVPMNPHAAADEKSHVLADCGAKLFITTEDAARTGEFPSPEGEKAWNDLRLLTLAPAKVGAPQADDYCIVYTSGSTSRPKGVVLGRNAVSANIRAIADDLRLSPDDKSIVFTPPAYTYALSQTLTHLWAGGAVLPWPHGLMYPAEILKAVSTERLTGLAANPTSMRMFLSLKQTAGLDLSSVRYVKSAGQPLYSNIARGMAALFPRARIVCTYGCTENSPRIAHYWLPPDVPDRDGPWPAGRPLAGTEVRIADGQGQPAAANETGSIEVGGSSLMRGYWNAPEITSRKLRDGWFLTGDLGFFDGEGRLNVVGRADNIIGVGHEKVSPEEVEAVISKIEGVGEVAVGGTPDPLLDQVPVALLVLDDEKSPAPDEISNICRKKLSSAKVPKRFFVIDSIPKTLYGKPDRKAIGETIRRLAELEPF
jgi:acyl-CoA synthetase (AMP-forming)/AMP-acid ligase II